ncbi:hypothetical protein [Piscirickettsia salmonis]|uniref:hypothetical protein n=1 Tax=Piscirickettsia salmonis TaxID=1238 RepID=UPI0007C8D1F0|nr:hypothetical protein A0O36_02541 [Piscirickettsiaceae bacterium NZ-RLO1]
MSLSYEQLKDLANYLNNKHGDTGIDFYVDVDSFTLMRTQSGNNLDNSGGIVSPEEVKSYWENYCQDTSLIFNETLFTNSPLSSASASPVERSIFDNIDEVSFEENSREEGALEEEEEVFAMPVPSTEYLQQLSAQLATNNGLTINTTTSLNQSSQPNSYGVGGFNTPFLNAHHTTKDTETDCCCVAL